MNEDDFRITIHADDHVVISVKEGGLWWDKYFFRGIRRLMPHECLILSELLSSNYNVFTHGNSERRSDRVWQRVTEDSKIRRVHGTTSVGVTTATIRGPLADTGDRSRECCVLSVDVNWHSTELLQAVADGPIPV